MDSEQSLGFKIHDGAHSLTMINPMTYQWQSDESNCSYFDAEFDLNHHAFHWSVNTACGGQVESL